MILRLMSLGIPVAGFFAAGVIAAQADPATAPKDDPAARAKAETADAPEVKKKKVIKLRVARADDAKGGKETEETVIIDGEEVSEDVEEAVREAVAEAMEALENAEEEIRVELDGEELEALTDEHREAIEKARARLEGMSERVAEQAAEIEVRIARKMEKAAEKAEKAAEEAAEAVKEHRVIILRDGKGDAKIEVEEDADGRTVVVIEGEDVKVITRKKGDGKADSSKK